MTCTAFAEDMVFWQVFTVPNEFEFHIPFSMMLEEDSALKFSRLDGVEQQQKDLTLMFVPNKRITGKKLNAKVILNIMINDDEVGYPQWGESIPFTSAELEKWEKDYIAYFADKSLLENTGDAFYNVVASASILKISGTEAINFVFTSFDERNKLRYNFVCDFYNGSHVYSFLVSIPFEELEYWTRLNNDIRDIIKTVKPI